jgi:hypothetical protein
MFEFFQSLAQNIINGIGQMFSWLGGVFSSLWNWFKEFIAAIFRPLLLFFQGIWYLLTKCFDIVVLAVQVIFGLFKVIMSVIVGIFHTFAGLLGFSGSSDYYYMPDAYSHGYNVVAEFLNQTGLSTIASIMIVFIWIATAYAVIRIAGAEQ